MRRRSGLTFASAWLTALFLFLFHRAWIVGALVVARFLFELWDTSPRLAALGWLVLVTSPVPLLGTIYSVASGTLDRFDGEAAARTNRRRTGLATSLWVGFCGWATTIFSSMVSSLVVLIAFPPPPDQDGALGAALTLLTHPRLEASLHTVVWIVASAWLFTLEQRARGKADS
jgi:hypothetical protein